MTTIIYALFDSFNPDVPRYVGKTSLTLQQRVKFHVANALLHPQNTYKENWIRHTMAEGGVIEGSVIGEAASDAEAYALEWQYIGMFRALGFPLTNVADKGPGNTGYKHTPEIKATLRSKGLGRKHSDETKAKMSALKRGKPLTDAHKKHIGDVNRGVPKSEDHREKIAQSNRETWATSDPKRRETVRQYGLANRGRTHTDEAKQKMFQRQAGVPKSPEHIARQLESQQLTWRCKAIGITRAQLEESARGVL